MLFIEGFHCDLLLSGDNPELHSGSPDDSSRKLVVDDEDAMLETA